MPYFDTVNCLLLIRLFTQLLQKISLWKFNQIQNIKSSKSSELQKKTKFNVDILMDFFQKIESVGNIMDRKYIGINRSSLKK
jgi:hypothetical protein